MRRNVANIQEDMRQSVLIVHELGKALRDPDPVDETLPPTMALLLMQIALGQVVCASVQEEADERSYDLRRRRAGYRRLRSALGLKTGDAALVTPA